MAVNKREKLPINFNLTVPDLLNNLFFGIVLMDEKNRPLVVNEMAKKMLGPKGSNKWKALKNVSEITLKTRSGLVNDFRKDNRVLRLRTQYLERTRKLGGL